MRLILTLTGGGSAVPDRDRRRTLSTGSLSIGRGAGNDWVLPDSEGSLSRTHCAITAEGGRFILTDLSTNGMYINGARQATERDSRIVLTDGDSFRLGDFEITAEIAAAQGAGFGAGQGAGFGAGYAPPAAYQQDPFGVDSLSGGREGNNPLDIDPLDDPLGRPPNPAFQHPIPHVATNLRGADPFEVQPSRPARSLEPDEDLFRGIKPSSDWQGAPRPDHAPATSQAIPPPRVVPAPPVGDIDFDALIGDLKMPGAAPSLSPGANPSVPPPVHAPPPMQAPPTHPAYPHPSLSPIPADHDPFADPDPLLKPPPARPVWDEPQAPLPVAPPVQARQLPPSAPIAQPAPDPFAEAAPDPFAEPARAAPQPAAPPPVAAAPPPPAPPPAAPVQHAPLQPAIPQAAAPQPVPPQPVAPPSAASAQAGADARAALAAFLDGAGVPADRIDQSDPEAALRAAGRVFRAMTEGVREVLISRAAIKSEMRLEQTMIAAHGNNALKFSVTADDAVAALLTPKRPGYMEPLAAAKEACGDIKSHEIAVMAGVQTALFGLLKRFDPDELEKRLTASGLAAVLPAARKARYWDSFRMTYGDISREAEDDFQAVFGRNFAKAYSAQTRKE